MSSTLPDILGKLDTQLVQVLADMDACCCAEGIKFCVVGAAARDFIVEHLYGIRMTRATADTDFAVHLADWTQFTALTTRLIDERRFSTTGLVHRYRHPNGRLVDLIPFGNIADASRIISWPDGDESKMNVLGFDDAFKSSCTLVVSSDPRLELRVVTLAGLVVLKLIAWDEKYPHRDTDATDIYLILNNYLDCGNWIEFQAEHTDMFLDPLFDFAMVPGRLLGRHMSRIMDDQTRERVTHILTRESQPDVSLRLPRQMHGIGIDLVILEGTAAKIGHILTGIHETAGPSNLGG